MLLGKAYGFSSIIGKQLDQKGFWALASQPV